MSTFLEKMFWREKKAVEERAARRPRVSKEISVMVAIATPRMMGNSERYTCGKGLYLDVEEEVDP